MNRNARKFERGEILMNSWYALNARLVSLALLTGLFSGQCLGQSNPDALAWSQFRGGTRHGLANDQHPPREFGEADAVVWKTPVEGQAWSSPVIANDQIWLTNATVQTDTSPAGDGRQARRVKKYSGLELYALCFDFGTGELLHNIKLFEIGDPPPLNTLNSFASPTPVIDEDFVYVSFGSMGTAAIDRASGQPAWQNTDYVVEHETGPGSSPWLHGDRLLLTFDGTDERYVVALDKRTGKQIWKTERSGELHPSPVNKKAFSTPLVIDRRGATQVVSPSANWVYGYDFETGKELWRVAYGELGFSNAPQPVLFQGSLLVCTGFMKSKLMAVTWENSESITPGIAWEYRQQVPCMSTPLLMDGKLYFVDDNSGVASCVDAASGSLVWRSRLGGGFSASPIAAGGVVYFCNRDGKVFVVEPGEEFKLVATNKLGSRIMATPAVYKDSLVIRYREESVPIFQVVGALEKVRAGAQEKFSWEFYSGHSAQINQRHLPSQIVGSRASLASLIPCNTGE